MAKWHDPDAWAALTSGETCVICGNPEGKPLGIIAELRAAYVTNGEQSPIRGYLCLVLKRHAVELHDLTAREAADLMSDMQAVSSALAAVLNPVKINIEMHGNSLPHLHLHFYPRVPGDPYDGGTIDWKKAVQPVYAPDEYAEFVDAVQEELAEYPFHDAVEVP